MSRISKVTGTVTVLTDNGASFTLSVTGHGPQADGLHQLGPYVEKLISQEVAKLIEAPPREDPQVPKLTKDLAAAADVHNALQAQVDSLGAALNKANAEIERLTAEPTAQPVEPDKPKRRAKG